MREVEGLTMPVDAGELLAQDPQDRPVGQLVSDATEQITRLVRDEMRLAAAEFQRKGKRVGVGAGLVVGAGFWPSTAVRHWSLPRSWDWLPRS